ncbi:hypothetical protein BH11PSE7_BH11PSE7_16700 [soil metagenome]
MRTSSASVLSLRTLQTAVMLGLRALNHAATSPTLAAQALIDALQLANAVVVGVEVTASEGSRSAQTLGKQTSGSCVVSGPDGLILTIG